MGLGNDSHQFQHHELSQNVKYLFHQSESWTHCWCGSFMPSCSLTLAYQLDLTRLWLECLLHKGRWQFHQNQIQLGPSFNGSNFLLKPNLGRLCCNVVATIKPFWNKLIKVRHLNSLQRSCRPKIRCRLGWPCAISSAITSRAAEPTPICSAASSSLSVTPPSLSDLSPLSLSLFLWLVHNQGCARPRDGPGAGQVLPG